MLKNVWVKESLSNFKNPIKGSTKINNAVITIVMLIISGTNLFL